MKERELFLAIGLPLVTDTVHKTFFISWTMIAKPRNSMLILPTLNPGEFPDSLAAVRNNIVLQAKNEGCTHLILMDTDQKYPHDTIIKLLSHGLPIVGAKVHRRYPPFDPILARGSKYNRLTRVPEEEWKNGELVEVDATGTGCILIDMTVFDHIKPPWFRVLSETKTRKTVGEDIYFCLQARQAGFPIYVDTDLKVGHLAWLDIDENFYDVAKAAALSSMTKGGRK